MCAVRAYSQWGFTLIELVVTMALIAILGIFVTTFMSRPIVAYLMVSDRATLTTMLDSAFRRMTRDIAQALPNSIRVSADGQTIEMYNVVVGERYRAGGGGPSGTKPLQFSTTQSQFNIFGKFPTKYLGEHPTWRVVVYNIAQPAPGMNAYSTSLVPPGGNGEAPGGSSVISPAGLTLSPSGTEDLVTLSNAFQFALPSPNQRMYVVDTPVTYQCNTAAQTLTRYWDYPVSVNQPTNPTVAPLSGGSSALVSGEITGCGFSLETNANDGSALVVLFLQGTTSSGETASLIQQVMVRNAP